MKQLFCLLLACISCCNAFATHIVGGDMTYVYLGNNNYEITLKLYKECISELSLSKKVPIYSFDGITGQILQEQGSSLDSLSFLYARNIYPVLNNPCLITPNNICVEQGIYRGIVNLPNKPGGYDLVYSNCCRNNTITNIINPFDAGSSCILHIDPSVTNVASPTFTAFPPVAICINDTLIFDHSATDVDGDSLVYSFCQSYSSDINGSIFNTPNIADIPFVTYAPGFNAANPVPGSPSLTINASTGIIKGFPTQLGQYLVGVCIAEYRNGILLSNRLRDFQFNVVNCTPGTVNFDIPDTSFCGAIINKVLQGPKHPDLTYLWSTGATTDSIRVLTAGTYWLTITASCGSYTDTVIIASGQLTNLDAGLPDTVLECLGGGRITFLTAISNNTNNNTYLWQDGFSNSTVFLADIEGLYWVQFGTLGNSCMIGRDSTIVKNNISTIPVNLGPDRSFCFNGNNFLELTAEPNDIFTYTYAWNDFDFSNPKQILQAGTYVVTISDFNCGAGSDTIVISNGVTTTIPVDLGADKNICTINPAASVTFSVPSNPNYIYNWNIGGNSNSITVNQTGTYTLTVTDATNNCTQGTDNVSVTAQATTNLPIDLGANQTLCIANPNSTTTLSIPSNPSYVYTWNIGGNSNSITVNQTGTYTLTVVDAVNCSQGTDNVSVTAQPTTNLPIGLGADIVLCEDNITQNVTTTLQAPSNANYTYTWNDGSTNNSLITGNAGTYTLLLQDALNCLEGKDTITITKNIISNTQLNNIFTPNGDGKNELFPAEIKGNNFTQIIYNRWGSKMYEGNKQWDGGNASDGVYFYIITEEGCNKNLVEQKGTVTLLKQ